MLISGRGALADLLVGGFKETQLGVLSVVDNVQNEMEKIESEQEKAKTDPVMTQMFGGAGDGKPGVLEEPGNGSKET